MWSKIAAGLFVALMAASLVVGGVQLARPNEEHLEHGDRQAETVAGEGLGQGYGRNRQTETDADGAEEHGVEGLGRGRNVAVAPASGNGGGNGQGQGGNRQGESDHVEGQGQGRGRQIEANPAGNQGQGQGRGQGQGLNAKDETEVDEWLVVEGTVVEIDELVVETADGETIQIGLGPNAYREEQGFALQAGETVRVTGYWEADEFKAGEVENLTSGQSIVLRDESGRPMWAGQGRRQG